MKPTLRNIILGTILTAGISGSLIFKNQIDKTIDVAEYFYYFTKYTLSEEPGALDIKINQKMLRECGIRNKYGEKVCFSLHNNLADEIFFNSVDDYGTAYECSECVKEQTERMRKAGRIWYEKVWTPAYQKSQKQNKDSLVETK